MQNKTFIYQLSIFNFKFIVLPLHRAVKHNVDMVNKFSLG